MVLASLLLMYPSFANSQLIWIARCEEPKGTRVDYVEGQPRQQEDGFSGVNPIFILSTETPNRIKFLWGPAEWARDALKLKERIQEALIIDQTPEKVTAINVQPYGVTQMYSLYPTKGLVYFTQHRMIAPQMGGVPSAATFYATCSFTN
jgi:hypothetical protein